MVIENTASNIGDVLLIAGNAPIVGVVTLTGYNDDTTGETGTKYFIKEFSYSLDGIFFSEWEELNNTNIQNIQISSEVLYINYRYIRQGSDATGLLSWVDTHLVGTFSVPSCPNYFVLPKSIFKDYFCYNPQQLGLCMVLTKKMFDVGILPEYIERGQTDNPQVDDRDFLDFWDAVCCFFSLIIVFSQQFIDIEKGDLLIEYLKQKGVYFCEDHIEMQELLFLKNNFLDQIRLRGTNQAVMTARQKIEKNSNSNQIDQYDGEFLRLICYDSQKDEFIFNNIESHKIGWNIGNSSPCYKGVSNQVNINKTYDDFVDVEDIDKYNLISIPSGVNEHYFDNDVKVLRIYNVPNGGFSGLGADFTNINTLKNTINIDSTFRVDPSIDYEITIQCKTNLQNQSFSFGLIGLDDQLNIFDLRRYDDSISKNFFLESENLNNEYYNKIRGIIYNKNFGRLWDSVSKYRKGEISKHNGVMFLCTKPNTNITTTNAQYWQQLSDSDFETNIGSGNQLKFPTNSGISRILPIFVLDNRITNTIGGELFICDIKIRPLVTGNFANQQGVDGSSSNCFLHLRNFTMIYFKNNNHKKTIEEINSIAERYLFPYNFTSKQILL